jgi:hypothetical protein
MAGASKTSGWTVEAGKPLPPQAAQSTFTRSPVTSHGHYVTFQTAEVPVSRQMFAEILALIARLRAIPAPA